MDKSAGKRLDPSRLVDLERLVHSYYALTPEPDQPDQRVIFGTSGHRGSAFKGSFNEGHILAIAQAICVHRKRRGVDGPLFLGLDTHALSAPALRTAIEVFAANQITSLVDNRDGYTPTPAISHAILGYNRGRSHGLADGVVITPSHNPPEDGGFKYNPPHGGPADAETAGAIQEIANEFLVGRLRGVRRMPYERARTSPFVRGHDYTTAYVADLHHVLDLGAVSSAGVRIGVDPMGGASVGYWPAIIQRYRLAATVVNVDVDPTFGFMPADWDGRIRMDCSSPYAMARLIALRGDFDVAWANDPDADRHGIVTRSQGLMNPNHYLAAAISYLFADRRRWPLDCGIGKTMVTSSLLDRLAAKLGRPLIETPVGFRWFVDGLLTGGLGFAGEESAGASFLRRDGSVWTTEKDGMMLGLLAAEITAKAGRDLDAVYQDIVCALGTPYYERMDAPASTEKQELLKRIASDDVDIRELAGEAVLAVETAAPGSGHPLGGIRVRTQNGWFAARPSGTEAIYKIYAESFVSLDHLQRIKTEARALVDALIDQKEDGADESR